MKLNSGEWIIMSIKIFGIVLGAIFSYEAGISDKNNPTIKTPYLLRLLKQTGTALLTIGALFAITGVFDDDVTIFLIMFPMFIFAYMRADYVSQKTIKQNDK